jgi:hypothetical protein
MSRKQSTATKVAKAKAEQLVEVTPEAPPQYHSILKVWRDMLDPSHQNRHLPPTADWCAVLIARWPFLSFKDCGAVQSEYFAIFDLAHEIIEQVHDDYPEAFEVDDREEDMENNKELYVFLMAEFQKALFVVQASWSHDDPDAGARMAALGEAQQQILGKQGLVHFLSVVGFPFTDEEQAAMNADVAEFRASLGV